LYGVGGGKLKLKTTNPLASFLPLPFRRELCKEKDGTVECRKTVFGLKADKHSCAAAPMNAGIVGQNGGDNAGREGAEGVVMYGCRRDAM
jgi:hypothetical protein